MKNLTIKTILEACHGRLYYQENKEISTEEVACVTIDSRQIVPGGVFIATKGEKVDGMIFIPQVVSAGAAAVICEREPEECSVPCIIVEDAFEALKDVARFYRQQLSIKVVGITGSVGKTSTKEMVAAVLAQKYKVCKTQGNFNNEKGLPITILSIREEHEVAVIEMGISDFGEMHRLSEIARPDFCIMTMIGQCHLENLLSREGILKAKSEIFDFMNPEGFAILNGDDDMLSKIEIAGKHTPVRFGLGEQNDVYATKLQNRGLLGTKAVFHQNGSEYEVEISIPGEHMVWNALAAAAIADKLSLTTSQIQKGLLEARTISGRSNLIKTPSLLLLDDCYNANPNSMKAALDLLSMATERKVALLGDMFELGEKEKEFHAEVGAYAAHKGIDVIICVGKLSEQMYQGAKANACEQQKVYYYRTREDAKKMLPTLIQTQDAVLIKASHGMMFYEMVEILKNR